MKKLQTALLTLLLLGFAGTAYAVNITVPSAPSAGYMLIATSTGQYIATTTDPAHFGSIFATSSTATSIFKGSANVNGTLTIGSLSGLLKAASGVVSTAVSNTDFQAVINLTTTGSSGASTFNGTTLNIPNYTFTDTVGNWFTPQADGNATSTNIIFKGGLLSTASSTINAPFRLPSLANGGLGVNNGLIYSGATTTYSSGLTYTNGNVTNTGVTSNVAGAGISLSGSTGAVTITNTIGYPFIGNATTTALTLGGLTITGKADGCATFSTGVLNSTGSACGSGGGGSFPFSADNTYAQVVYSTSTPTLWFKSGLFSSSTITIGAGGVGSSSVQYGPSGFEWTVGSFGVDNTFRVSSSTALAVNSALIIDKNLGITFPVLSTAGTVNNLASGKLYSTATTSVTSGTGISFTGTAGSLIGGSNLTITNSGVTSNVAGAGISLSGSTGAVTVTNTIGYPFVGNATGTTLTFNGGLVSVGSTTVNGPLTLSTTTVGCLLTSSTGLVYVGTCAAGGSGAYPFTPATNFGALAQATTGIPWFQNGLQASSTSQFANTNTINATTTQVGITGNTYAVGGVYFGSGVANAKISQSSATQLDFAINRSGSLLTGFSLIDNGGVGGESIVGTNTDSPSIRFNGTNGATTPQYSFVGETNTGFFKSIGSSAIKATVTGTQQLIIGSGIFGLGTTTPDRQLSVQGDSIVSGTGTFANLIATGTITTSLATGCVSSTGGVLTSAGIACGTGGVGSAFPFTPGTNFGVTVNSTSTPINFTAGIMASTTSRFGTTTALAGLFGTATTTKQVGGGSEAIGIQQPNANSTAIFSAQTNQVNAEWLVQVNGLMGWGAGGASDQDINLSRFNAGGLAIQSATTNSTDAFSVRQASGGTGTKIFGVNTTSAYSETTQLLVNGAGGGAKVDVFGNGTTAIRAQTSAASDVAFASFVTGDAQLRFTFLGDGTLKWGSGASVADTGFSRLSAGVLAAGNGNAGNTSAGIIAAASSTFGGGTQAGGLTVSGGATTTLNMAILSSLVIGTSTGELGSVNANTGNLVLYNTNTAGASPALVLGGNVGGDTDFWMARQNDNNGADNDFLQIGKGLVPGTTPFITIDTNGNVGIASTSPWARLTLDRSATLASSSILVTEYKIATTTAKTLDARDSNSQLFNIGVSATTITLAGFLPGSQMKLMVCNPNAVAGTITWATSPANILQWAGGVAPTQTTTANKCDLYSFFDSAATSTTGTSKIFGNQNTF